DCQQDFAARSLHRDLVSRLTTEEGTADRRLPGDVPPIQIDLVFPYDAIRAPRALVVFYLDVGAEVHHRFAVGPRLDDRDGLQPLRQPVDTPIDLAELLFSVDVLGVLAPIALGGG